MSKKQLNWNVSLAQLTCTWSAEKVLDTANVAATLVTTKKESTLTFNPGALPGTIGTGICGDLAIHGLKQKLADSISGMSKNGYSILEQKVQMAKIWKTLIAGKWSVKKAQEKKISLKELKGKVAGLGLTEEQLKVAAKLGLM